MQDNQRQTLWAYIAGIIDANGCFMIIKQLRGSEIKKLGWNFNPSYLPAIKIAMIEKEAVSFITQEAKFGKYRLEGARKSRHNSKSLFHWYLRERKKVIQFLINVIPYLKIKKNRAEFLLEFCKKIEEYRDNNGTARLSIIELDYREHAYIKMRMFNGNKVAATTKPQRSVRISDSLNSMET